MLGEQIADEQIREAHFVMIRDKNGQEYRLYGKELAFCGPVRFEATVVTIDCDDFGADSDEIKQLQARIKFIKGIGRYVRGNGRSCCFDLSGTNVATS
jgi:hypothetical protein